MVKKTKRQLMEDLVSLRQPETKSLEVFSEVFAPQMAAFEKSPRARMLGGVSDNDKRVLGECLTNYMLEANNQANMGLDPVLALNVITSVFGNSVLPLFTSEQPLQDKQGVIYFENIISKSTRGNVTAGQKLAAGASAKEVYPTGFASDELEMTATANEGKTVYTATLGKVRKNCVVVKANGTVVATDNGSGAIMGVFGAKTITGTVTYTSGAVSVTFSAALETTDVVTIVGATDFEEDGSLIPKINVEYDSRIVKAHTYLLQADTSILASYISKKRLGIDANKRAVEVLQQQILREITNDAIKKIAAANMAYTTRTTDFSLTAPTGVSVQAHYNSYNVKAHALAQNKMADVSGKGNFQAMIADSAFCAFLTGLNEFKQEGTITDDPTYFGTLGGRYGNVKVVRAPQLDNFAALGGKKGQAFCVYQNSKIDAAAVFAPFMPVMVTNDIPVSDNLTQRRSLIASMATTEVVVDKYIQRITLSET